MNQDRNFQKEVLILQQEVVKLLGEKVMIQAILDDALQTIQDLKQQSAE